jgi:hypothetical protein
MRTFDAPALPQWLPDWARAQFLTYVAEHDSEEDDGEFALFSQLVTSAPVRIVWEAMGRRLSVYIANRRRTLLQRFGEHYTIPPEWPALDFVQNVRAAREGFAGDELLTQAERKKIGSKIERLARALAAELDRIRFGGVKEPDYVSLPPEFEIVLLVGQQISDAIARNNPQTENWREKEHKQFMAGVGFGAHCTAASTAELLGAIATGGGRWGSARRKLARPNEDNARRLYFLRMMTGFFRRNFDTPLRGSTLAVASVFFDTSDLDESQIAQLAP